MKFINKLFSWLPKKETVQDSDLPPTEPFIINCNNPLRRREINYSRLQKLNNPIIDMSSTPRAIKKYIESNLKRINQIITEGPPNSVFIGNDKQADSLPTKYLLVYNLEGKITELGFETYSIFIHPENETSESVERIFYNEIKQISFIPFDNYNDSFVIFAIESKFGIKILIFLEKKYMTIIKTVINQGKEDQSTCCSIF